MTLPKTPVIVAAGDSPHAIQKPVAVNAVHLADPFWTPRLRRNAATTLPSQHRQLEEAGSIDNFRAAAGKKDVPFKGPVFTDSDIYKWLEAASWALASEPGNAALRRLVDTVVAEVEGAQRDDGYLNTYFTGEHAAERWMNLRDQHEMYCAGHLFQAAVANHRATRDTRLLAVASRFADHICDLFGPESAGKRPGACGHEEVEMGLVELARETGDEIYIEQARYFLGARGGNPSAVYNLHAPPGEPFGGPPFDRRYFQDHVPLHDLAEVTGHAVRQMYYSAGATDVYLETGEPALMNALNRQWRNMIDRRMYVTGGLGARHAGEAFGEDYELPNATAYAETCAAIGGIYWAWRMLLATGKSEYADYIELALYNGALSGLSLGGEEYFYVNPLADDGGHRRQPWFGCACCPPNVARLLAQLPGYFYSLADDEIFVHLFATGRAEIDLVSGNRVVITQQTNYPWDGEVEIKVKNPPAERVRLRVRRPGWAEAVTVKVDGEEVVVSEKDGYLQIDHARRDSDTIHLSFAMPARRIAAHPSVAENQGCVALARGPLVYCVEQADHGVDVRTLSLLADAPIEARTAPDLLGGITTLHAEAVGEDGSAATLTAIPYYAWANREAGPMRVWIPVSDKARE